MCVCVDVCLGLSVYSKTIKAYFMGAHALTTCVYNSFIMRIHHFSKYLSAICWFCNNRKICWICIQTTVECEMSFSFAESRERKKSNDEESKNSALKSHHRHRQPHENDNRFISILHLICYYSKSSRITCHNNTACTARIKYRFANFLFSLHHFLPINSLNSKHTYHCSSGWALFMCSLNSR